MKNNILTIVTPAFERPKFLERKLYHFSIQNCQNRIITIDTNSKKLTILSSENTQELMNSNAPDSIEAVKIINKEVEVGTEVLQIQNKLVSSPDSLMDEIDI